MGSRGLFDSNLDESLARTWCALQLCTTPTVLWARSWAVGTPSGLTTLSVFGAIALASASGAQTIGEQLAKSVGLAGPSQSSTTTSIPDLRVRLHAGDQLTYDVTVEYRTDNPGGGGYSINRYTAELVFTVDDVDAAGIVLSWHDLKLSEKVAAFGSGSVSIGRDRRIRLVRESDWGFVRRFVLPLTLPPSGRAWRDEFRVVSFVGTQTVAQAWGKAYILNTGGRNMEVALYGRDVSTQKDWEVHSEFNVKEGTIERSRHMDLVNGIWSYMEWKSLRRKPKTP